MIRRGIVVLIVAGATSVTVTGCQRRDAAPTRDTAPTTETARAQPETAAAATRSCGVDARTVLTGDGIGSLRIDTGVDDVKRSCRVLRDTTGLGIEGQPERTILVDLGRDTVTAVVSDSKIWRVHVRSRAFRTAGSLGVGTPVSTLRARRPQILMGEGKVFLRLATHCGLSFRLRGVVAGRASSLAQIPDTVVVDEVLAVGC